MIDIQIKELNLFKDWSGSVFICLNENCTDEKFIVIKSDHWSEGAEVSRFNFTEGELTKITEVVRVTF